MAGEIPELVPLKNPGQGFWLDSLSLEGGTSEEALVQATETMLPVTYPIGLQTALHPGSSCG